MKILILCLLLSGCGCNVSKGDKVNHIESGANGVVLSVNSGGAWTDECDVSVRFDGGSVAYWIKGFEFDTIKSGGNGD